MMASASVPQINLPPRRSHCQRAPPLAARIWAGVDITGLASFTSAMQEGRDQAPTDEVTKPHSGKGSLSYLIGAQGLREVLADEEHDGTYSHKLRMVQATGVVASPPAGDGRSIDQALFRIARSVSSRVCWGSMGTRTFAADSGDPEIGRRRRSTTTRGGRSTCAPCGSHLVGGA